MQIQSSGGGVPLSCTLPAVALKAAIKAFFFFFWPEQKLCFITNEFIAQSKDLL